MKTKELIRQLQEADPSGELECSVGNQDISFIDVLPCYYDGCQRIAIRDPNLEGYDIIGMEIRSKGSKVVIESIGLEDYISGCVWRNKEPVVTYDSEHRRDYYQETIENYIKKYREIERNAEISMFAEWMKNKLELKEKDEVKARELFGKLGLTRHDPLKVEKGESYYTARHKQWDKRFSVDLDQNIAENIE